MTKRQVVEEIHLPSRKNFERRKYSMRGISETLQADLIDMQAFSKGNRGYRYILIVIDVFSKKLYAEPLRDKTAKSVADAMEIIIKKVGQRIRNIQSDDGKEFINNTMKQLLAKYNINHYSTYSIKKASIVERSILTIKRYLYKLMTFQGKNVWYKNLKKIIDTYNNTRCVIKSK